MNMGIKTDKLDRLVHLSNVADLYLSEDPDFELAVDYANLVKVYGFWNLHHLVEGDVERLLDHPLLEVIQTKRRIENPMGLAWSRGRISRVTDELGVVDTVVGDSNRTVHDLLEEEAQVVSGSATMFQKVNRQDGEFRSREGVVADCPSVSRWRPCECSAEQRLSSMSD